MIIAAQEGDSLLNISLATSNGTRSRHSGPRLQRDNPGVQHSVYLNMRWLPRRVLGFLGLPVTKGRPRTLVETTRPLQVRMRSFLFSQMPTCESIIWTLGKDVLSLLASRGCLTTWIVRGELDNKLSSTFGNGSSSTVNHGRLDATMFQTKIAKPHLMSHDHNGIF